jgi:hypothetical protein
MLGGQGRDRQEAGLLLTEHTPTGQLSKRRGLRLDPLAWAINLANDVAAP